MAGSLAPGGWVSGDELGRAELGCGVGVGSAEASSGSAAMASTTAVVRARRSLIPLAPTANQAVASQAVARAA